MKELCARVRAVIRRKEYLSPVQDEVLTCGPISVNTAARRCLKNGEPVELTMKEFDLLVMLMRNAGRVLTGTPCWIRCGGWNISGMPAPWMCISAI